GGVAVAAAATRAALQATSRARWLLLPTTQIDGASQLLLETIRRPPGAGAQVNHPCSTPWAACSVPEQMVYRALRAARRPRDVPPAINAALAAVPAAGGVLELSPGVYRITAPIRLAKKIILAGAGFTEDPAATSRAAAVFVKDGNFDGISVEADACILRDFQLDGNAGNGGAGIVVKAARGVLENSAVMNQGGVRVRIGSSHATTNLWRIRNRVVVNNGSAE